jgi:uncharacterized protein (TIGR03790 family)
LTPDSATFLDAEGALNRFRYYRRLHPADWDGLRTSARTIALALITLLCPFIEPISLAGGGPENVLLLVNANSDDSKTIANYYIRMRQIPPQNVVYINWRGGMRATKGDVFRSRILMPAIKWIDDHKLNPQIDYLVYSADFPTRIDLNNLFTTVSLPPRYDATASINGASYLTPYVVSQDPGIAMPHTNWYVPGPVQPNLQTCQQLANAPSRGFRSLYQWDQNGKRTKDPKAGQRYLLSTVLGVTYGRGNTVDEILSYLKRAVEADGTRPKGTIYYMENENIRSNVRDKCYPGVAAEIKKLNVRSVVQKGILPQRAPDVMGLMAGVNIFNWKQSGSKVLPGAICEHLTSYGGDMSDGASQTPLSEFLRQGAAGSSGTVKEPGAVQFKFPLPTLQLHYARGCSLAEAFYQSVTGPYQLLIVGDPLCQPWAEFPTVTVEGIKPDQQLSGSVAITPSGRTSDGKPLRMVDVFLDGKLLVRLAPGKTVNLDTTKVPDGYHEIRVVGTASGPIETQGRIVIPVTVNNKNAKLELSTSQPLTLDHAAKLRVSVRQTGATAIEIRQNSQVVARVQGEAGDVEIAATTLGRGPSTLQAFSEGEAPAVSAPMQVVVK